MHSHEFAEIEEKLRFADYLLHREPCYPDAAVKHILFAANQLVMMHLGLPKTATISPILASQKLSLGNKEEKGFADAYLDLWKLSIRPLVRREDAENAYKATKAFLDMVKRASGSA
ncbi:MAG: hypothetical protein NTY99_00640 [DPANN group archaeon]|nr:hypothetical protein [DPANN group archaeon]